jgi:hypothetical protein
MGKKGPKAISKVNVILKKNNAQSKPKVGPGSKYKKAH